jgi:hypothetical protein
MSGHKGGSRFFTALLCATDHGFASYPFYWCESLCLTHPPYRRKL